MFPLKLKCFFFESIFYAIDCAGNAQLCESFKVVVHGSFSLTIEKSKHVRTVPPLGQEEKGG